MSSPNLMRAIVLLTIGVFLLVVSFQMDDIRDLCYPAKATLVRIIQGPLHSKYGIFHYTIGQKNYEYTERLPFPIKKGMSLKIYAYKRNPGECIPIAYHIRRYIISAVSMILIGIGFIFLLCHFFA